MNCTESRATLTPLLYDDLPPEQAAALRDHLAACPACREEETALRQVVGHLSAVTAPRIEVSLAQLYQEASRRQQHRLLITSE